NSSLNTKSILGDMMKRSSLFMAFFGGIYSPHPFYLQYSTEVVVLEVRPIANQIRNCLLHPASKVPDVKL
ncbi:MAG: hypothetical protein PHP26_04600, partial [Syntrophomonas sp.]|nr:hypothetical protein [Syntrophomonas sp.]